MSILLCSTSNLKLKVVQDFFPNYHIETFDCGGCGIPNQPIFCGSGGHIYPKKRIHFAREVLGREKFAAFDLIISIENAVNIQLKNDYAYVLIYAVSGVCGIGKSLAANIPEQYVDKLTKLDKTLNFPYSGYKTTIGELICADMPEINPKDWSNCFAKFTRSEQIKGALVKAQKSFEEQKSWQRIFSASFLRYPDFPKPGVLFQDMFPLFADKNAFRPLIKYIARVYEFDCIDLVVGLESRGFCLGTALAYKLHAGFVPIRKAGKLPGETLKIQYEKEYGQDTFEIDPKSIPVGSRVLIIDDLIATGGSMRAACDLISKCHANIIDCCVLKNVSSLKTKCDEIMSNFQYTVLF
jgi:adenine phosphoribosyltransferase